jgi:hypothetical protein
MADPARTSANAGDNVGASLRPLGRNRDPWDRKRLDDGNDVAGLVSFGYRWRTIWAAGAGGVVRRAARAGCGANASSTLYGLNGMAEQCHAVGDRTILR